MCVQGCLEPVTIEETDEVLGDFPLGRQRNRTAFDPFLPGPAVKREPCLHLVDTRVVFANGGTVLDPYPQGDDPV